ncbi:MAG: DUF3500 domain-containing protein [Chloroflexi bacterium]|nr:DUF3500 domain-containing protein [Chloroflexota bacterium]
MTTVMPTFGVRQRNPLSARQLASPVPPMAAQMLSRADAEVAAPYAGVTVDGTPRAGLFPLHATGVSTESLRAAAQRFLADLSEAQRQAVAFPLENSAWLRWSNIHAYVMRHGLLLEDLDSDLQTRAMEVMHSALSERGFTTARDIMKLNYTIGEITQRWDEYGDWLYWLSIFGQPSAEQPWGWQIDGHHLIVNCVVVGDQLVLTPMFMGSEPTLAEGGKYAGTRVFEAEEQLGLAFARSLSAEQRHAAVLADSILSSAQPADRRPAMEGRMQGGALRDNVVLPYEGLPGDRLAPDQQERLLELVDTYVGRMRDDHSRIKMDEVREHLAETHFMWMGGLEEDSVFYYRIHSPVVLIEFDHLRGVALDNDEPARTHIHTVVRTPNGNDYGRDLLRQHYARFHQHSSTP